MTFMAVTYDSEGFAGVELHDSVEGCLDAATAAGCLFATVGEHPKASRQRHFVRHEDGWHELETGEELDRLRRLDEPPRMFWRVA